MRASVCACVCTNACIYAGKSEDSGSMATWLRLRPDAVLSGGASSLQPKQRRSPYRELVLFDHSVRAEDRLDWLIPEHMCVQNQGESITRALQEHRKGTTWSLDWIIPERMVSDLDTDGNTPEQEAVSIESNMATTGIEREERKAWWPEARKEGNASPPATQAQFRTQEHHITHENIKSQEGNSPTAAPLPAPVTQSFGQVSCWV